MDGYSKHTDQELISLLKKEDEAAFSEIYQRYNVLLFVYAYKKLRDEEVAKDLVQEVFLNLWKKRKNLELRVSVAGYFYSAVRNKAFNIFAHQKIEQEYLDSLGNFLSPENSYTDHLVREKEIAAIIDMEISRLPKGMREVFMLSRKDYLSHKEIADKLDMSEEAVSKQIKRALKILKVRIGLALYLAACLKYSAEEKQQFSALEKDNHIFFIKMSPSVRVGCHGINLGIGPVNDHGENGRRKINSEI